MFFVSRRKYYFADSDFNIIMSSAIAESGYCLNNIKSIYFRFYDDDCAIMDYISFMKLNKLLEGEILEYFDPYVRIFYIDGGQMSIEIDEINRKIHVSIY